MNFSFHLFLVEYIYMIGIQKENYNSWPNLLKHCWQRFAANSNSRSRCRFLLIHVLKLGFGRHRHIFLTEKLFDFNFRKNIYSIFISVKILFKKGTLFFINKCQTLFFINISGIRYVIHKLVYRSQITKMFE